MTRALRAGRAAAARAAGVLAAGAVVALLAACGPPRSAPVRVLFVGNSFVAENDLPGLFATLSGAGRHPVTVDLLASGGWTLAQHAHAQATHDKLAELAWTFVVLQEQSVIPALATQRQTAMYPAVREFATGLRAQNAEPVLLQTWARREGYADVGFRDFAAMQAELTAGYQGIADELGVRVAPAGAAWQRALARDPALELWKADGSHPSLAGSYLAACVLYAALYRESPVGLPAPPPISEGLARRLQAVASEVVLAEPARWHLR